MLILPSDGLQTDVPYVRYADPGSVVEGGTVTTKHCPTLLLLSHSAPARHTKISTDWNPAVLSRDPCTLIPGPILFFGPGFVGLAAIRRMFKRSALGAAHLGQGQANGPAFLIYCPDDCHLKWCISNPFLKVKRKKSITSCWAAGRRSRPVRTGSM